VRRARPGTAARLAGPLGVSVVLHTGLLALLVLLRPGPPPVLPPLYRVNIVAAPPGPRSTGVVSPTPPPPAREQAPTPTRAEALPKAMPAPPTTKPRSERRPPPKPATPTPRPAETKPAPTEPPPEAGGGPTGGRGTDVATVRTEGVEFPYPGYLDNIVRQIAKSFNPPRNVAASAEVFFLIRRDGTVSDFRFLTRSGNYAFDLEAQGAVEQAAAVKAFGPLPNDFPDDVLPVIFSFNPQVLR
jgi:periplasmic protein TonB